MRSLLVVSILVASSLAAYEPPVPFQQTFRDLPVQFLDQRVDNFDTQNFATFEQAYFENDEFFDNDGPLFIFIGGEWTAYQYSIRGGHIYDMAREFNGSLFYPEHRYYGRSFPTENLSTENLRFLTVEQALADLASFIVQIKQQSRYARSEVVLVGGSYSATMAAWFRQIYPHLAVGAWASSAPVLAKVDFHQYKDVVGDGLRSVGGEQCFERISAAIEAAQQLIADNRHDEFRDLFALCEGFGSHPQDVAHAFSEISEIFASVVQYHWSGHIEGVCDDILTNSSSPSGDLQEFARFVRSSLDGVCNDNYEGFVEWMRNTTLTSRAAGANRQWHYQTCTEFGWFQTSTSEDQPFGDSFPIDLFYAYCRDIYGLQFDERAIHNAVDRTNVIFGGWNSRVRNVYFTNGSLDPWRVMGVQEDLNDSSPADVIPDASHCADLASVSANDSEEMLQVKSRIISLVRLWLNQQI